MAPLGIWQQQIFLGIDEFENIGERITLSGEIGAAKRHRDDLTSRSVERRRHRLIRGEFPRAQKQPRSEFASGNDEEIG